MGLYEHFAVQVVFEAIDLCVLSFKPIVFVGWNKMHGTEGDPHTDTEQPSWSVASNHHHRESVGHNRFISQGLRHGIMLCSKGPWILKGNLTRDT